MFKIEVELSDKSWVLIQTASSRSAAQRYIKRLRVEGHSGATFRIVKPV